MGGVCLHWLNACLREMVNPHASIEMRRPYAMSGIKKRSHCLTAGVKSPVREGVCTGLLIVIGHMLRETCRPSQRELGRRCWKRNKDLRYLFPGNVEHMPFL